MYEKGQWVSILSNANANHSLNPNLISYLIFLSITHLKNHDFPTFSIDKNIKFY